MNIRRKASFGLLFLSLSIGLFSAPLVIKLGSTTPAGSPWDNTLKAIAAGWMQATGGEVQMKIYPGGIAGAEQDMIRKMNFNALQGAALSSIGLMRVVPDITALAVPFLLRNEAEFAYVLEHLEPRLMEQMEDHNLKVITWASAGWSYFFTREAVYRPDELKRVKMAGGEENPVNEQAWKDLGYDIVQVPFHEILTAFSSGMVEACYTIPVGAAAYQIFGIADNMLDLPICPVLGSIVISTRTWNRVPAKYREDLIRIAREETEKLTHETLQLEADAIQIMQDNGLVIHHASEEDKKLWQSEASKGLEFLLGKSVSPEFYEQIQDILKQYRTIDE